MPITKVGKDKIGDNAVDSNILSDNSVNTDKIQDGAITNSKICLLYTSDAADE